jgi:sigma-B regulation protein RsbU (phosphoserine phosphatase)
MTIAWEVVESAERLAREGGVALPEAVLAGLVRATGATGAVLGRGGDALVTHGQAGPAVRRVELHAGRDLFWLDLVDGVEPDPNVCLAARVALSSWLMREELKKARFAERRRLWEVESLRAIAEVLGGTLDPRHIAEELVVHATALLDARRGEVWLSQVTGLSSQARVAGASATSPCEDGTCTIAARVGGEVLTVHEAAAVPDGGLLEEGRLAVPVVGRRGRLGTVALAEREVRGGLAAFGPTDTETLQLFASQAAVALENSTLHVEAMERQLLERELELAALVQKELFPSAFVAPPGLELTARTEPCRQVGGDVYDLITTPAGVVLMAGDVAGKGVAAALLASSLQAAVRLLARHCPDVGELTLQVHQHLLASSPENKFATLFLACLRPDGTLEYVSAGHNPAIIVAPKGDVELLHSSGPPVGLLQAVTYQTERVQLPPGGLLLAYTDGFSEASDPRGEEFGTERLAALAIEHRHGPLETLVEALFGAVDAFTEGAPAHDDRTALAVRRVQPA